MVRRMFRYSAAAMLAAVLSGCGSSGAEVRISVSPSEWKPVRIVMAAPAMPGDAIPPSGILPAGLTRPKPEEASAAVFEALRAALAASATTIEVVTGFTRSETAEAVAPVARRYLETREVDPAAAHGLAEEGGADAVLLTALIRYGPEAETELSTQAKSVNTKVGTTDVGISSASTRVTVWYNAQFRCALVRLSDGAVLWDAGVRRRKKPGLVREISQDTVLADAAAELCRALPWAPRLEEEAEPGSAPVGGDPAAAR